MVKMNEKYKQAIWDFTETLQAENQMESALSACMEIMKRTIGCEVGLVWLQTEESGQLMVMACASSVDLTGITIDKSRGVVGHVFETAESLSLSGEIGEDSPLYGTEEVIGIKVKSQLVTSLKTPGGLPFGCIQLVNKNDGSKFAPEDVRLAESLSMLIALDIDDKNYKVKLPEKPKPIVSLRGVKKDFTSGEETVHVLKGIDLDIYPGEFLVVLGESGCGKTTMMNIIGGMDSLTEGSITIDGTDFSHPDDKQLTEYRRDYIGYIFQSYHLMPNLSAIENLEFIAEISRDPVEPEKALELVGLSDRAGNFPSQMSGGQQQRVSIARAITKNPKLILADEPTAALDYETSIEVLSIVEDIVRNHAKTVMMITHNPEIAKMADRVVKLRNGVISGIRLNLNPLSAKELSW